MIDTKKPELDLGAQAHQDPIVQVPAGHEANYKVSPKETPEDAKFRRFREGAIFVVGLLFVIALSSYSFWVLYDSAASAETKRSAQTILASIGTAFLGFLVGKKS